MVLGTGEMLLVILVIILLIFGPKKIPELARAFGRAVKEYKEGLNEPPKKTRKLKG